MALGAKVTGIGGRVRDLPGVVVALGRSASRYGRVQIQLDDGRREWVGVDEVLLEEPPLPAEVCSSFDVSLSDIVEWLEDHGQASKVARLRTGASQADIAFAEARVGAPFPLALRHLYETYDGEEGHGGVLLDRLRFMPLEDGVAATERVLTRYWGCPRLGATADEVDQNAADAMAGDTLLQALERGTSRWWVVASDYEIFHTLVNLDSGRVIDFVKQDGLYVRAASLEAFFAKRANMLWGT